MAEKERILRHTDFKDIPQSHIRDIAPEQLSKLYPYRAIYGSKYKALILDDAITVARITQEGVADFDELESDENGKFFYILAAFDDENELTAIDFDEANAIQNTRKAVATLLGSLKVKNYQDDFYTINEPFNRQKFLDGKLKMFYISAHDTFKQTEFEKMNQLNHRLLNDMGVRTNVALNEITNLTQNKNNAGVLTFTDDVSVGKYVKTTSGDPGFSVVFPNHTLLNSVNAIAKTDSDEYDDLSLNVKNYVIPVLANVIETDPQLSVYFPWWNYELVMPVLYLDNWAKLNKDGLWNPDGGISIKLDNLEDQKLIEDMILITYGFAQSWKDADRYNAKDSEKYKVDVGAIKEDYVVGHACIPVFSIADKKPVEVLDGLYMAHLMENPDIKTSKGRWQKLTNMITAISPFIWSSLAIAEGGNFFNEVYLPWFLEPTFDFNINLYNVQKVEKAQVAKIVDTRLLEGATYSNNSKTYNNDSDLKFLIKTNYFFEKFSQKEDTRAEKIVKGSSLPKNMSVSNTKQVETDQKIFLPRLTETVDRIDVNMLPRSIGENIENQLKYLYYLPLWEDKDRSNEFFQKFYSNKSILETAIKKGDPITTYLPSDDEDNTRMNVGKIIDNFNDEKNVYKLIILIYLILNKFYDYKKPDEFKKLFPNFTKGAMMTPSFARYEYHGLYVHIIEQNIDMSLPVSQVKSDTFQLHLKPLGGEKVILKHWELFKTDLNVIDMPVSKIVETDKFVIQTKKEFKRRTVETATDTSYVALRQYFVSDDKVYLNTDDSLLADFYDDILNKRRDWIGWKLYPGNDSFDFNPTEKVPKDWTNFVWTSEVLKQDFTFRFKVDPDNDEGVLFELPDELTKIIIAKNVYPSDNTNPHLWKTIQLNAKVSFLIYGKYWQETTGGYAQGSGLDFMDVYIKNKDLRFSKIQQTFSPFRFSLKQDYEIINTGSYVYKQVEYNFVEWKEFIRQLTLSGQKQVNFNITNNLVQDMHSLTINSIFNNKFRIYLGERRELYDFEFYGDNSKSYKKILFY